MNKKIFGLKLGTIISFVACLLVAVFIWLYAKYMSSESASAAVAFFSNLIRG